MLLEPNARLAKFNEAYLWWAKDFEKKANQRVDTKAPKEAETLTASLVPSWEWMLLIGAGVAIYAFSKGRS